MSIYDEIRAEQKKLKDKSLGYKIKYYAGYYKWHVLAVVAILFVAISLIKSIVTAKDTAFQAVFVNCYEPLEANEFTERIGIDVKEEEVIFDGTYRLNLDENTYDESSYITVQKVMALTSAHSLDVILGGHDVINYFGKGEMLMDLRDLFGESYIESLGDKVMWVDTEPSDENDTPVHIPVGIDVTEAKKIVDKTCYPLGDAYYSVIVNTDVSEYAKEFYDYINE